MLTTCPDCATEVSDQAFACHRCGHPINSWIYAFKRFVRERVAGNPVEGVALLMILAFALSLLSLPVATDTMLGVLWMPIWLMRGGRVLWGVLLAEWVVIAGLGGLWIAWLKSGRDGAGSADTDRSTK